LSAFAFDLTSYLPPRTDDLAARVTPCSWVCGKPSLLSDTRRCNSRQIDIRRSDALRFVHLWHSRSGRSSDPFFCFEEEAKEEEEEEEEKGEGEKGAPLPLPPNPTAAAGGGGLPAVGPVGRASPRAEECWADISIVVVACGWWEGVGCQSRLKKCGWRRRVEPRGVEQRQLRQETTEEEAPPKHQKSKGGQPSSAYNARLQRALCRYVALYRSQGNPI